MKLLFSPARLVVALSLATSLPLVGQTTPATVAPAGNRPLGTADGQEAKEKAEDAALLQQLDADAASSDSIYKPKDVITYRGRSAGGRVAAAPVAVPFGVQNILTRPVGAVKPLMVRTSDPDPKTQASLEEDLSVMGHILGKAVDELGAQANSMKAMGIDVFFTPSSSPLRSLYLDNYGAVFFLGVNFPLVATSDKHVEEKPTGDSDWEDARQELYGQRSQGIGEPAESYSEEKVQKLKEKLLEALKNATNIRELKSEEFVTIWISGGATAGPARVRAFRANAPGGLGGNAISVDQMGFPAKRSVMTIRVTKSEIDAYAKGKMTLQDFQKRARFTTYTGDSTAGAADGLVVGGFGGRAGP
jgi:hypothetical protein